MTRPNIARVINSTVEPLSDIARSSTWRRIEQSIADEPAPPRRASRRLVVGGICAAGVVAAAVLFAIRGSSSSSPSVRSSESLVAATGEHVDRSWSGGELTLYGPGAAELVHGSDDRITVIVAEGIAVVRRDIDASAGLSVRTPSLATDVTSSLFAVRVYNGATVMATGDEETRILLEDTLSSEPTPADDVVEQDDADMAGGIDAAIAPEVEADTPTPPHGADPPAAPAARTRAIDTEPAGDPVELDIVPPSPVDDVPEPQPPSLDELYAAAEDAMRRGDSDGAEQLLETIVSEDRQGMLATSARYDLALLAIDREQYDRALDLVDTIIASGSDPNLRKSAQRLRCRIREAQGNTCDD